MSFVYAINLCVPTVTGDRYILVAINPYPIVVVSDQEEDINKILLSDGLVDSILTRIPNESLKEQAVLKIRRIDEESKKDFDFPVRYLTGEDVESS